MVDAADLKSASLTGVWVRVPPSAVNQPQKKPRTREIARHLSGARNENLGLVIARHDSTEAI
jgi:DNA-directed RNA polymerase subunit E'/Rpb7